MKKTYMVGRGASADIQIPRTYESVSHLHLRLDVFLGGRVGITDLGSGNGTFIKIAEAWQRVREPLIARSETDIMLGEDLLLQGSADAAADAFDGESAAHNSAAFPKFNWSSGGFTIRLPSFLLSLKAF